MKELEFDWEYYACLDDICKLFRKRLRNYREERALNNLLKRTEEYTLKSILKDVTDLD